MLFVILTVEEEGSAFSGRHNGSLFVSHQVCFELAAHRQYTAISEHVCTYMHCSYLVDASLQTACIVKVSIKRVT